MTVDLDLEVLRIGAVFLALAIALALFVRRERRRIVRLGIAYGLSLVFRVVSVQLATGGMTVTPKTFSLLALLLQGYAFLGLAAVVVFEVVLRAFRLEPPRILRDLTFAASFLVFVFYLFSTHNVD